MEKDDEIYQSKPAEPEQGLEIPYLMLDPTVLYEMIKEFVLREGTDYGFSEVTIEKKIEQVRRQFEKGDLKIVFDGVTETSSIVPKK